MPGDADRGASPVGSYLLVVWTRTAGSQAQYETAGGLNYILTAGAPCTSATVSLATTVGGSAVTSATIGTPVLLTPSLTGSCVQPQYKYWMLPPGGSWTVIADYPASGASGLTQVWSTTSLTAGTYQLVVWVRTNGSQAQSETAAGTSFTLR